MSRNIQDALSAGFDYLQRIRSAPGMEARSASGDRIYCPALPYAVALYAFAMRRLEALGPADAPIASWLKDCCDADGMVRFYGPSAEIIGPDLDDTALIWSERAAYSGLAPPEPVEIALAQSRCPSGAFNTWPSPPEDAPAVEEDAAVNANILALLGALGQRDQPAEGYVNQHLDALTRGEAIACPYYPDATILVILAYRAMRLGGLEERKLDAPAAEGIWGDIASVLGGDRGAALTRLLDAQAAEGYWPWAPLFVGGHDNHFPDGRRMSRPLFGDEVITTALALFALAEVEGLEWTAVPVIIERASARRRTEAPWEALVGVLAPSVSFERLDIASKAIPQLTSPDGSLRLEIGPHEEDKRFYRGSVSWTVSYRGDRSPTAREDAAIEELLRRLEAQGPPTQRQRGPSRVISERTDAADLRERLAPYAPDEGPVHVRLHPELSLKRATAHLAEALSMAGHEGPELRFEGLPHCALPWPEELILARPEGSDIASPKVTCATCSDAHHCVGPSDLPVRRRSATQPWTPVHAFARSWSDRFMFPESGAWRTFYDALNRVPTGPLSGIRWSIVGVIDVVDGVVDPAFRLDIFHGHREGLKIPGQAMLNRLQSLTQLEGCLTDSDAQIRALRSVAERCPVYPALYDGPKGRFVPCYAETSHLDAQTAWRTAEAICRDAGRAPPSWGGPLPRLLGVSVTCTRSGQTELDLYVYMSTDALARFIPPDNVSELRGPGPLVGTFRLDPEGNLTLRKWDLAWWSAGRDDRALLDALGVDDAHRETVLSLLGHADFGLHPTTMGWRPGGRRIYVRVV